MGFCHKLTGLFAFVGLVSILASRWAGALPSYHYTKLEGARRVLYLGSDMREYCNRRKLDGERFNCTYVESVSGNMVRIKTCWLFCTAFWVNLIYF